MTEITRICCPDLAGRSAVPRPWRIGRVIDRPEKFRRPLDEHQRLALVEGMIAERHHIGTGIAQHMIDLFCDAETMRGILAVDRDEIRTEPVLEQRQLTHHRFAARPPDDIAEKDQPHFLGPSSVST